MGASRAVVSDQAVMAWLARHRLPVSAGLGGVVVGEVLAYRSGGTFLNLWGMGFAFLFGVAVCWFVAVCVWWNRRRVQLAKHKMDPQGPIKMARAMWSEKRRVAWAHARWAVFCASNGITGTGKVIPRLHNARATVNGDVNAYISPGMVGVKGAPGMTPVERIRSLSATIAETVGRGCVEVIVASTGVGSARVSFLWTKPMDRVLSVADMPWSDDPMAVVYGARRDGSAATVQMCDPTLVGGITGSGKSGWIWAALTDLNRKGIRYDLHVSNGKGGAELKDYRDVVGERHGCVMVQSYAEDVPGTVRIIAEYERLMKARSTEFPHRQWLPAHAEEWPLTILVVDELVELMLKMDTKSRAIFDTCVSQGRAVGFWVIALSQKGQVEVLKSLRDFIPQRLCLEQRNATNTNMFLGDGAETDGAPCSRIHKQPGLGYSYSDREKSFQLFRAAFVDDADRARVARGELPVGMNLRDAGDTARQCAVYRFLDSRGRLLYVGHTVSLKDRWQQHAESKPWWPHVDLRRTFADGMHPTWFPSVAQAVDRENWEIEHWLPLHNKQRNTRNPLVPAVADLDLAAVPEPRRAQFRLRRNPAVLDPDRSPEPSGTVTPIDRRAVARAARRTA